jgi:hypothetical protein
VTGDIISRREGVWRVLSVRPTAGPELSIYISPTGRSIRVFRGGVELKAPGTPA